MTNIDFAAARQDPQLLADVRTCLAETASRWSTIDEREVAIRWLEEAETDDEPAPRAQTSRRRRYRVHRLTRRRAPQPAARVPTRPPAPASLVAVDALRRQQQRIRHRSRLIAHACSPPSNGTTTLTMGDSVTELLADITEAAGRIETIRSKLAGEFLTLASWSPVIRGG